MSGLNYRDFTGWGYEELARLFNRSFAKYFVDFEFDATTIEQRMRIDGVDSHRSRIVERDGSPCAIAWIVPRGNESRLAAMGVVLEARGKGVGKALLRRLLEESEAAGESRMVLEVIRQNDAAVRLYESQGFRRDARLLGFRAESPAGEATNLEEIEPEEVADAMRRADDGSLPWQMSGDNLARTGGAAFRSGPARVLVSRTEEIRIHGVVTESGDRGRGAARRLLLGLFAQWPGRRWSVPVIVPEGPATRLFHSLGFVPLELEQLQMHRDR